jgi:hypothetical protein
MSGSETKERRGLPLVVLGVEGANEDGKGWVCLKDEWGGVLEMVSGVPSWMAFLGKMKESRDCDKEGSEEGSAGPRVAWAAKEGAGGWPSGEGVGRGEGELGKGRWCMTVFDNSTVFARITPCERGWPALRKEEEET